MSSTTLSPINQFLVSNDLRISDNPCISPDFCLDWEELKISIRSDDYKKHSRSEFKTSHGQWCLIENSKGDHAWELTGTNELSNINELNIFSYSKLRKMKRKLYDSKYDNIVDTLLNRTIPKKISKINLMVDKSLNLCYNLTS